jgi:hypothetical protein
MNKNDTRYSPQDFPGGEHLENHPSQMHMPHMYAKLKWRWMLSM